tara:strand:+ start:645 stop:932 length:288 start_codon:yes stop_codon:yes gene_type:complete
VEKHTIGIKCRQCDTKWKLHIPLSGNNVDVFATICPCSAIIVGNYNSVLIKEDLEGIKITNQAISNDQKYLTNGHFDILDISPENINRLPELSLE